MMLELNRSKLYVVHNSLSFLHKALHFYCRKPLELFPDDFWTEPVLGGTGAMKDRMDNTNLARSGTSKEDVTGNINPGEPATSGYEKILKP
jgi:hypothetical protein